MSEGDEIWERGVLEKWQAEEGDMWRHAERQAKKRGIRSTFYRASSAGLRCMDNGKRWRAGVSKHHIPCCDCLYVKSLEALSIFVTIQS